MDCLRNKIHEECFNWQAQKFENPKDVEESRFYTLMALGRIEGYKFVGSITEVELNQANVEFEDMVDDE